MSPPLVGLEPSILEVIHSALRGDELAFEEVIRIYSRQLYCVAYAILQNPTEAEDVVQETFLTAHRNRWRLFSPAKFPAWLTTVAKNKARDLWRKRVRHATDSFGEGDGLHLPDESVGHPSEGFETNDREQLVKTLLASLPEQWRAAIALRYLEGLDYATIEQRMGLSNGAVRGILGRAMARLRDQASSNHPEFRN